MKKLISTILIFILFSFPVYAGTNIASTDLERGSSQKWSITDGSQTGLDISGDFTFSIWVLPESINQNMTLLGKSLDIGSQVSYFWWINSVNKLVIDVSDNGTQSDTHWQRYTSNAAVVSDTVSWVHLAVTFDISGETMILYKDGSSISNTKTNGSSLGAGFHNSSAEFAIGWVQSLGGYFDGLIDDVQIFSDIRTPTEISDYYNTPCDFTASEGNLEGWWKFENDGTDEDSNGNDLTNNNSATFGSIAFSCVSDTFQQQVLQY